MTLVEQYHNDHKAIHQRIAAKAAALEARKRAEVQAKQAAALEKYFELKKPKPDPVAEWVERQKENHKPVWFSVISAVKVTPKSAPTIRNIQRATCDVYGIDITDLLSSSRAWDVARPRMVSMFLARELTDLSLNRIGSATGGVDHTSVINAVKRIGLLCKSDVKMARAVAQIRERLA